MMNIHFASAYILVLPLVFLAACGGGSGNNNGETNVETTSSNNPPIAQAGVDKTIWEKQSTTLDAGKSSDEDGDTLSYEWTQNAGNVKVALSNNKVSNPTFIAPEVEADTDVTFNVAVSDGEVATPINDEVTVKILNRDKMVYQQQVIPNALMVNAVEGKVIVDFNYNIEPANTLVNGLVLKLYWDSSKLNFQQLSNVLAANHLGVSKPQVDQMDGDSNASTDKYVVVSWLDIENTQWPADTTLPAKLFSAQFTAVANVSGETQVNLTPKFTSPSYGFYSQTVSVGL